jgi:hypothetical protein
MRCTFKTVFYVNESKERNGIVPIMGRVTINGTIAQFSCKQSVTKAILHLDLLHTPETYRHDGTTLQRQDTEKSVCHVPR